MQRWILALILVLTFSLRSYGYPEMVRHGYANCTACHVSPNGGGILTPYGRSLSQELLSTWGAKNESDFMYGFMKLQLVAVVLLAQYPAALHARARELAVEPVAALERQLDPGRDRDERLDLRVPPVVAAPGLLEEPPARIDPHAHGEIIPPRQTRRIRLRSTT